MWTDLLPAVMTAVAIKATLVLIGALAVAAVLRRASGASRHALWTTTTVALLSLPLLESRLPTLPLSWFPKQAAADVPDGLVRARGDVLIPVVDADATPRNAFVATDGAPSPSPAAAIGVAEWLAVAWLLGFVGCGAAMVLGLVRSRRLIRRATSCRDPRLLERFRDAQRIVGVHGTVRLALSDAVRTPMTGGVIAPVVLLPSAATTWIDDRLDAVLRHELVHVRQRDALRHVASRLSVVTYWFHPLAWRAARLAALARELACDEAVLRLGTRPSHYARHLLDLADPLAAPVGAAGFIGLDHPHLEQRVMAILRAPSTPAPRRHSTLATLAVAAWTVTVAAAGPATAQDAPPAPPTAPAAPAALPVALAARIDAPSAPRAAQPALPVPPADLAMPAHALPAVPAAPLPPRVPAVTAADCEIDGDGYRTGNRRDRSGPVRMHSTTIGGIQLCLAMRGSALEERFAVPRGRLAPGAEVTLAARGPDGTQRLEILGTASGNRHTWIVNGRERPFDAAAEEWRDAMLDLMERNAQKAMVQGDEARARGELARVRADEARIRSRAAQEAARESLRESVAISREAMREGRVALDRDALAQAEMAARNAGRMEVERRDLEARVARLAERSAELAEVRARGVGTATAPRVARGVAAEERAVVAAGRALERTAERMRDVEARVARAMDERGAVVSTGRATRARVATEALRDAEVRARSAGGRGVSVGREPVIVEGRLAEAEIAERTRAAERRIDQLDTERRVSAIEREIPELLERLERAIRRVN